MKSHEIFIPRLHSKTIKHLYLIDPNIVNLNEVITNVLGLPPLTEEELAYAIPVFDNKGNMLKIEVYERSNK